MPGDGFLSDHPFFDLPPLPLPPPPPPPEQWGTLLLANKRIRGNPRYPVLPRNLKGKKWDCLETHKVCVCLFVSRCIPNYCACTIFCDVSCQQILSLELLSLSSKDTSAAVTPLSVADTPLQLRHYTLQGTYVCMHLDQDLNRPQQGWKCSFLMSGKNCRLVSFLLA